jgi:hypothetical protein
MRFQKQITSQWALDFHGSHRTGKTVTAIEVAKKLGIAYVNAGMSSSDIWISIKPSDTMTFGERIQVQEFLLDEIERLLARVSSMTAFVIDRTPVDLLAYLLTNIDDTTSSIFDSRGQAFIDRCVALSAKHFTHFVVVPPGIPVVGDVNKRSKAYNSRMYKESLTDVIIGVYYRYFEALRASTRKTMIVVPDNVIDLDAKVEFITTSLKLFL